MNEDVWRKIAEIHNSTKALTILGEEVDPEHELYLPAVMEQRDAYAHIMRAKTAELGLSPQKSPDTGYIGRNLDRALGHEYRAFFDAADFLSIIYREKILNAMKGFSPETIEAVLPDFYSEVYPAIENIPKEIAEIRRGKDIGDGNQIIAHVQQYRAIIEKIATYWDGIVKARPALLGRERQVQHSKVWSISKDVVIALIGAAAGAVAAWFFM